MLDWEWREYSANGLWFLRCVSWMSPSSVLTRELLSCVFDRCCFIAFWPLLQAYEGSSALDDARDISVDSDIVWQRTELSVQWRRSDAGVWLRQKGGLAWYGMLGFRKGRGPS